MTGAEAGLSGWLRRIGLLAVGTAVGHGSVLLALPLLTRIYPPEEFGLFGVFAAIAAVVGLVAALRYEYALPLCAEDDRFAALRRLCVLLSLAVAVATAVACWALGRFGGAVGVGGIEPIFWLAGPCALGASWMQIGTFSALRDQRFAPIAAARAAQGLVAVAAQIALGLSGFGGEGLIIGHSVGLVFAGTLALGATRSRAAVASMREVAAIYRSFPLVMSWSAMLNALGLQLPVVLMASCFGLGSAGRLLVAQRVLSSITQLVGSSAGQDFYARAAALIRGQEPGLPELVRITTRRLLAFSAVVAALLAPAAWWAFGPVLGAEWEAAGVFLIALLPAFALQLAVSPVSGVFSLRQRHGRILVWNLCRAIIVVAAIGGAWALGASQQIAVGALSAGYAWTFVVLYGMVVRAAADAPAAPEERG